MHHVENTDAYKVNTEIVIRCQNVGKVWKATNAWAKKKNDFQKRI